MAKKASRASVFFIIFLTGFIDMLGIGIIIPVIPVLFFGESGTFFGPEVSEATRSIIFGFLIASYPFMQFFGAPMLGALSDKYGRKPVLLISLFGTMIGYALFAWAVITQNLVLLFVARMLPGFTGGNVSVILSTMMDVSREGEKAKNLGFVGVAFGLGFILGPSMGGILADDTILHWFSPAVPFWFTAILTFLNMVFVFFLFRETLVERRPRRISLWTGVHNVVYSFKTPRFRVIFTIVLLLSLGFNFFTQFFSVFLIQKFEYSEKDIGFLFGYVGLWMVLTQGILVRRLARFFRYEQLVSGFVLLLAFALMILLIPTEAWWFYVLTPLVAIGHGVSGPNMTAVVSSQVSAEEQGEILGINQSMQSFGQMLPPMIAGYINAINWNLPIMTASLVTLLAWVVYVFFFQRQRRAESVSVAG